MTIALRILIVNGASDTLPDLVCYCFEFSASDIQADVIANNGRSLILEKIIAEKRAGGCRCGDLHPEGR